MSEIKLSSAPILSAQYDGSSLACAARIKMKPEGTTDGDVDRFFPVLQTMLERGDAAAWAPYLLGNDLPSTMPGSAPHILMGMVLDDDTVPNTTNRALARALNIPLVPPMRQEVGIVESTDKGYALTRIGRDLSRSLVPLYRWSLDWARRQRSS